MLSLSRAADGGLVTPLVTKTNERAAQLAIGRGVTAAECFVDAFHEISADEDLAAQHIRLTNADNYPGDRHHLAALEAGERAALEHLERVERFAEQRQAQIDAAASKPQPGSFEAFVERVHRERFAGAPEEYEAALDSAAALRPDLAREYLGHSSAGGATESFIGTGLPAQAGDPAQSLAELQDTIRGIQERFGQTLTVSPAGAAVATADPLTGPSAYPGAVAGATFTGEAVNLARQIVRASGLPDATYDLLREAVQFAKDRSHNPNANPGGLLRRALGLGDKIAGAGGG